MTCLLGLTIVFQCSWTVAAIGSETTMMLILPRTKKIKKYIDLV